MKDRLTAAPERFTVENLQKAHEAGYHKALVDIISMVKHTAYDEEPLLTAEERVQRSFEQVCAGRTFTSEQQAWLERIRAHLIQNLTVEREDFEAIPVLADAGGWNQADRAFDHELAEVLEEFNAAVAA